MGSRAQVEVQQEPHSVFLYTHWGADEILQDTIKGIIKGKLRWDNPNYLTRVLFDSLSVAFLKKVNKRTDTDTPL